MSEEEAKEIHAGIQAEIDEAMNSLKTVLFQTRK